MTQLLEILPKELKFIVEVKKQSSCLIQLTNNTYHNVAFKVKTTSPKKYSVRPNVGIVDPKSTFEFVVTMQAQKVAPDMACRDKFLIQSTIVPVGTTEKDITPSMFAKDNGNYVEEVKMRVALISPPESPVLSPINGVLKQGPFFEPSLLKDPVGNRVEILTPPQTHQTAKSSEFKMTNGHELNTAKDAELKPKKDGIDDQELKPKKDGIHDKELKPKKDGIHDKELKPKKDGIHDKELKPKEDGIHDQESKLSNETVCLPNIDVVIEKELKLEQDEELKQDKDAINDEHFKLADDMESPSLKNEEFTTVNAMEELKLASDIEEMKSKLHVLESKLNEAEATISKLTEEKRQGNQEQKILREELEVLRSRTSVKKVYTGFPLLFVAMTALISIMVGYLLHR